MRKIIFFLAALIPWTLASSSQAQTVSQLAIITTSTGGANLHVINSNGTAQKKITQLEYPQNSFEAIAWSPDGTQLAARLKEGRNWDIYAMGADGNNRIKITDDSNIDRAPAFSPDGRKVAFVSLPANEFGSLRAGATADIYVVDADGSNRVQLTDDEFNNQTPAWSPDGTLITFVSNRDGNYEVYVMGADGSNPVRLTDGPNQEGIPTFSPDGSKILFFSEDCSAGCNQRSDIVVMNVDGSDKIFLTDSPDSDAVPSFSPDGRQIAFASNRDGKYDIYLMNADGSNVSNLTNTPDINEISPVWSPVLGPSATLIEAISWGQIKNASR